MSIHPLYSLEQANKWLNASWLRCVILTITMLQVVISQMNGRNYSSHSVHLFHIGKTRIKLSRGWITKARDSYSKSMQVLGKNSYYYHQTRPSSFIFILYFCIYSSKLNAQYCFEKFFQQKHAKRKHKRTNYDVFPAMWIQRRRQLCCEIPFLASTQGAIVRACFWFRAWTKWSPNLCQKICSRLQCKYHRVLLHARCFCKYVLLNVDYIMAGVSCWSRRRCSAVKTDFFLAFD